MVFAWKLCLVSMGLWLIYIGFLVIGLVFGFCLEIMFGFYGVVVDLYFFDCFLVIGLVFGFCLEIMFGFYGVVVDLYFFGCFFGYWFGFWFLL